MNGTDVLVYVNTGTPLAPVWEIVGSQRDCTFSGTTATIDLSNKETGRYAEFIPGRNSDSISFSSIYVPDDDAYLLFRAAREAGNMVMVRKNVQTVDVEECVALITELTENMPDQEAATVSVTMQVSGGWYAVGS